MGKIDEDETLDEAIERHDLNSRLLKGSRPTASSACHVSESSGRPRIHLGLFVHRVDSLPPGLYALPQIPTSWRPSRR